MIDWLLDLDTLKLGAEGVHFALARAIPAWGWVLIALGAAALAFASYARLDVPTLPRRALAVVRTLLLVLLVLLLAGPELVRPNETEEPDWVVVLADRSQSMTIQDVTAGTGSRTTRDQQLRAALADHADAWRALGEDRVMVWMGVGAGAFELGETNASTGADAGTIPDLGEPSARRTSIGGALDQALRRAAARPLAGIVILSDGRSQDSVSRSAIRALRADRVPVFSVALGSEDPPADLSIRRVGAPRIAFVNDTLPVRVELDRAGGSGPVGGEVELVDRRTGEVLDRARFDAGPDGADVTLTTVRTDAGEAPLEVRVVPDGGADLIDDNNRSTLDVTLVDRPIRLVYFDGYPRWEYRYLKNLVVRESSITSSTRILSPGRRFLREGDIELGQLPSTQEAWRDIDVIVMGDVDPGQFTPAQLEQIKTHVGSRGAGLLWIGGAWSTPNAWAGTPMADLLPFSLGRVAPGGSENVEAWKGPVLVRPAPAADTLGVLSLNAIGAEESWPAELADPASGWSRLWFAQRLGPERLKPTAEVLAVATPVEGRLADWDRAEPVIASMRFGAGRVVYVGTDETWRWRYGRGELYTERFWVPLIRMLGRESLTRSGRAASLEVTPRRATVGQAVRVAIDLLDQSLVDAAPATLRVRVERIGGVGAGGGVVEDDQPGDPVELLLQREGEPGYGVTYSATWLAGESGAFRIEPTDPLLAGTGLEAMAVVWQSEDELREPRADHAMLATLAQETGGRVLSPDEVGELPRLIQRRQSIIVGAPDIETLWDTPLALLLVLLLTTLEWVGRRLVRLT